MKNKETIIIVFLSFFTFTVSIAQDIPKLQLGGAIRFNYNYSTWKKGQEKRGGDFGYDVFRLNAQGSYKDIDFNAEYRFYSSSFGGGFLKQGWIGHSFNKNSNIQIGLTHVPFGNTPFDSHSWFFGLNYYVGLEDDYDMGVKYSHIGEKITYNLAFFKNAEEMDFGSNTDVSASRYSYDVGSIDLNGDGKMHYRNKEVNQINGKISYKLSEGTVNQHIGISGLLGGLYNLDTDKTGNHYAAAINYNLESKKWGLNAQYSTYKYSPKTPNGESKDNIAMVAYGSAYLIAANASTYTVGVSYKIPVNWHPISELKIYNDYGYMQKHIKGYAPTQMNVTGVMITAGKVYSYLDFAAGKNHPWLGPEWTHGLAEGNPNAHWEMRMNLNIGYYF